MLFGLRVDVDTLWGLERGVRNLLDLFDEFGIKATFFIPFGPDRTGRTIKRIICEKGFFQRLVRIHSRMRSSECGVRNYPLGIRIPHSAFHGTLLPSPLMGANHPLILKEIEKRGHEVAIHGFDHYHWRDDLLKIGEREIEQELGKATNGYQKVFKRTPHATAAPGWRCTGKSLLLQERYSFQYASDTRGFSPFFPLIPILNLKSQISNNYQLPITNYQSLNTLQLPVTLPTLDELIPLGKTKTLFEIPLTPFNKGGSKGDFTNHQSPITNYQLYCAHAEVEGGPMISLFRDFLQKVLEVGAWRHGATPLRDIAKRFLENQDEIPRCRIEWGKVPGRTMEVAVQMKNE